MNIISKALAKGGMATAVAGAMAMTSAAPAQAADYRDRDGIDAGDIIAGAVILGGIAAVASTVGKDRYDDRRYRDGRHYRGDRNNYRRGNGRRAVERCVRTAERDARRFAGYRFADVTQIRDVERTRYGWRVKGRMVVDGQRGFRGANYDRYDRRDRRGYGRSDRGRFTCHVERGRVAGINYSGIRGLR